MKDLSVLARGACVGFFSACIAMSPVSWAHAGGAQDYPERPVKIVSVTSAGTGMDDYTRLLAQYLTEALGKSFFVENRPGANMILASSFVAKAEPDGYTLLLAASGGMAANPFLFKQLPYDPLKDYVPIARLSMLPVALVVSADSPYHSVADLVNAAKERPGRLNFASSSTGYQVALEAFNQATRIQSVNVPYKAMNTLLLDLITRTVDYTVAEVSAVVPHVQAGKLRALAVSTPMRVPVLKDVPTFAEVGLPSLTYSSWTGLFAPAGTPPAIAEKLGKAALEFVNSPTAKEHYAMRGSLPYPADGAGLRQTIIEDQKMWQRMISQAGVKPQ